MTSYSVNLAAVQGYPNSVYIRRVLLRAGSYDIKIYSVQISMLYFNAANGVYSAGGTSYFNHYIGSAISGGSSFTPVPMREGSAPSSASVVYQTATSGGTTFTPGTAVSVSGTPQHLVFEPNVSPITYQPPSDVLISAGSVFEVAPIDQVTSITANLIFSYVTIYFDEYHLVRSR